MAIDPAGLPDPDGRRGILRVLAGDDLNTRSVKIGGLRLGPEQPREE